ncbi:MAG TPA: hypothetical protein VGC14_05075 [Rhizobium sp.]
MNPKRRPVRTAQKMGPVIAPPEKKTNANTILAAIPTITPTRPPSPAIIIAYDELTQNVDRSDAGGHAYTCGLFSSNQSYPSEQGRRILSTARDNVG